MNTFIKNPHGIFHVRTKKKTFILAGAKRAHKFAMGLAKAHPKVELFLQGETPMHVTPVWRGGFSTEHRWL